MDETLVFPGTPVGYKDIPTNTQHQPPPWSTIERDDGYYEDEFDDMSSEEVFRSMYGFSCYGDF